MKIKRVIRFQDEISEETLKKNVSKKRDTIEMNKIDVKQNCNISEENHLQEYSNDFEEEIQETENQESFSYNASDELIRCVERVISRRRSENLIGVFGINSDVVVNNMCQKLRNIRENVIFIGKADCSSYVVDIYNEIAAMFLNYISERYRSHDMDYYVREVMRILESVYEGPRDYYDEYESPLTSLTRISKRYERDRNLLSAIDKIRQIGNYSSYSRGNEEKFLIAIEMETLDYKALNSLLKLNSSNLVIIVFSLLEYNLARMSLSNSAGFGSDFMNKFFGTGNYILAGQNSV